MNRNLIPIIGTIPSLDLVQLAENDNKRDLIIKSWAPYRRFAIEVADDGLDSFGLQQGNFAVFREARYPNGECQICLVRFGDDVSIRLFEGLQSETVCLRVSGDRIPPMELAPTDFSVVGILDGVILSEFAETVESDPSEFDWGC